MFDYARLFTAPDDYVHVNRTVQLTLSKLKACIPITIVNDNIAEQDESFMIELRSTERGVTLDPAVSAITIIGELRHVQEEYKYTYIHIFLHFSNL